MSILCALHLQLRLAYIYESEIGNERLDLSNNFRLRSSLERIKHDIEYCLLFGLLLHINIVNLHESKVHVPQTLTTSASASGGAAAATGAAAVGTATSWMFKRDFCTEISPMALMCDFSNFAHL